MTRAFSGDVAGYYAKYRRGYPPQAVDALQEAFGLGTEDVVLDLDCGTGLATSCGTLPRDRDQYRRALGAAGFGEVRETVVEYTDQLTPEQIVGGVCPAVPTDRLPAPEDRPAFAEYLRRCLPADRETFTEHVRVAILTARVRRPAPGSARHRPRPTARTPRRTAPAARPREGVGRPVVSQGPVPRPPAGERVDPRGPGHGACARGPRVSSEK
nr:hypothetical protein KPHV_81720 [Kitasatospora purpeofusca]